jgi:hypothetical protein
VIVQPADYQQPIVEVIAETLGRHHGDDGREIAAAVIARLTAPDVANLLVEAINTAVLSASLAYAAREDLYESPSNGRVLAEVTTNAVLDCLRRGLDLPGDSLSDAAAAKVVSGLSYKDWTFQLVKLPDGRLGVRVEATVGDTRQEGVVRTTRCAAVMTSIEGAAFRAIMEVEEHEARERFLSESHRIFDPHGASGVVEATNRRRPTGAT